MNVTSTLENFTVFNIFMIPVPANKRLESRPPLQPSAVVDRRQRFQKQLFPLETCSGKNQSRFTTAFIRKPSSKYQEGTNNEPHSKQTLKNIKDMIKPWGKVEKDRLNRNKTPGVLSHSAAKSFGTAQQRITP
ncbi:MAG: hypothetical protein P8Y42_18040 [Exilibacterium sp.]